MYKVEADQARSTVRFRATGKLTLEEVKHAYEDAKVATDAFRGRPHIVLADMRGLSPMSPEVAHRFGELIQYGRTHGVQFCVHLSDSSIARLQTARLAREVNPQDNSTTDVVSV